MDGLFDRDWFFKDERGALGLKALATTGATDNDERHRVPDGTVLQPAQETSRSCQVKIDDESVNFRLGQLDSGTFRFRLHIYPDVQTAENAFEHADFLQVPRYHHG